MEVVLQKLKDRSGNVALHTGFIVLGGAILLMMALQVHQLYATINNVIDRTNEAVLSAAAANVAGVYGGVRESSGTARKKVSGGWASYITTSDVRDKLATALGARESGADLVRAGAYRITDLDTKFVNAEGSKLNFTSTLTLEFPMLLAGDVLPPLRFRLEVRTTYEPKF